MSDPEVIEGSAVVPRRELLRLRLVALLAWLQEDGNDDAALFLLGTVGIALTASLFDWRLGPGAAGVLLILAVVVDRIASRRKSP